MVYDEEGRPQQSTDTTALEKIIDEILAANPKQLEQYRAGKETMLGFFVGQVMKASKGQASPQIVNELLTRNWGESHLHLRFYFKPRSPSYCWITP